MANPRLDEEVMTYVECVSWRIGGREGRERVPEGEGAALFPYIGTQNGCRYLETLILVHWSKIPAASYMWDATESRKTSFTRPKSQGNPRLMLRSTYVSKFTIISTNSSIYVSNCMHEVLICSNIDLISAHST